MVFWVLIILSITLCAVSWMFWDEAAIRFVRENRNSSQQVYRLFAGITVLGESRWVLIVTCLAGLYLSITAWVSLKRSTMLSRISLYADMNFAFFTVALSGISASLLKNSIGRARPKMMDELGISHFNSFAFESTFASFPSGHSTTFGAFAMVLILRFPRLWPVWLVLGLTGAASRVMVQAHYVSDSIAGFTFGMVFTLIAARFVAKRDTLFWLPSGSNKILPMRKRFA